MSLSLHASNKTLPFCANRFPNSSTFCFAFIHTRVVMYTHYQNQEHRSGRGPNSYFFFCRLRQFLFFFAGPVPRNRSSPARLRGALRAGRCRCWCAATASNGHVRLNISAIAYPYPISYPYPLRRRIHIIRTYPYTRIFRFDAVRWICRGGGE